MLFPSEVEPDQYWEDWKRIFNLYRYDLRGVARLTALQALTLDGSFCGEQLTMQWNAVKPLSMLAALTALDVRALFKTHTLPSLLPVQACQRLEWLRLTDPEDKHRIWRPEPGAFDVLPLALRRACLRGSRHGGIDDVLE